MKEIDLHGMRLLRLPTDRKGKKNERAENDAEFLQDHPFLSGDGPAAMGRKPLVRHVWNRKILQNSNVYGGFCRDLPENRNRAASKIQTTSFRLDSKPQDSI